jgi:hypothetical protein
MASHASKPSDIAAGIDVLDISLTMHVDITIQHAKLVDRCL